MNLEEAKALLRTAVKFELRDHAFGDCEVTWYKEDTEIADGYFGGGRRYVAITSVDPGYVFDDAEADELRKCFASEQTSRNDETGPDDFEIGRVMPGLTLDGVKKELTGE